MGLHTDTLMEFAKYATHHQRYALTYLETQVPTSLHSGVPPTHTHGHKHSQTHDREHILKVCLFVLAPHRTPKIMRRWRR